MRRGSRGRIWHGRDNAAPSALRLESGWTVGTYVKIVALAAFSIAILILIWRLQPGRNLESRNPGLVFPLYQKFANGIHVVGGRGSREGHGRRIRSHELNPTFDLRLGHCDAEYTEFYIEMKVGRRLKPFYFHVDTASGQTWVHCGVPDYESSLANIGPNGRFVSKEKHIVKCIGPTASLCRAFQYKPECDEDDEYECNFSVNYGDNSYYEGVVVNESLTVPTQDGTERSAFVVFGCVLHKDPRSEILPLATDGVAALGKCKASLVNQFATSMAIDRKVLGICLGKATCRAGQVGYISLGMDFEEKFAQSKSVWVKLVGRDEYAACGYAAKLLFISIGAKRITVGNAGMALGFDTGADWTFLPKDVYDQVLDELESLTFNGNYIRVKDNNKFRLRDQRICWHYAGKKRKRDGNHLGRTPIDKFPPLKFEYEGVAATELQYLIVQPEKYMTWDEKESKLCVSILVDKMEPLQPALGAQMMRQHLFVFDITNKRIRWKPSPECVL